MKVHCLTRKLLQLFRFIVDLAVFQFVFRTKIYVKILTKPSYVRRTYTACLKKSSKSFMMFLQYSRSSLKIYCMDGSFNRQSFNNSIRFLIWPPFTFHIICWQNLVSSHTFFKVSIRITRTSATVLLSRFSAASMGVEFIYYLRCRPKMKSYGFRTGECGGLETRPPFPVQLFGQ